MVELQYMYYYSIVPCCKYHGCTLVVVNTIVVQWSLYRDSTIDHGVLRLKIIPNDLVQGYVQ